MDENLKVNAKWSLMFHNNRSSEWNILENDAGQ